MATNLKTRVRTAWAALRGHPVFVGCHVEILPDRTLYLHGFKHGVFTGNTLEGVGLAPPEPK